MAVETLTDPDLGEVRRETGVGHVVEFTHETGKRNAYVKIKADGLQHPLGGWLDTLNADMAMLDVAAVSLAEGRRVRYRIDVHRRSGVAVDDRSLEQLDKSEKVRDLVALELFTGGVHNGASGATGPQDESGGPDGATAPSGAAPANVATDAGDVPPPSDDDAPGPPARGPKLAEAKPWEATLGDGSPNLGSYEVVACASMVEHAWELLVAHWRAELAGTSPPSVAQARGLGRRLLFCADRVQAAIRPDGRVDRMANSHTRARGAVRTALELHTPPWGAQGDAVGDWMNELTMTAVDLLSAGVGLLLEFER